MDLVEESYSLGKKLATTGKYGLIRQINRGVVSIPTNIATRKRKSHLGD